MRRRHHADDLAGAVTLFHEIEIAFRQLLRVVFNDLQTKLAACVAGQGIAQSVAFGLEPFLADRRLIQLLPDWAEERYTLYSYYPSRHLPPAKVRVFLEFLLESLPAKRSR